MVKMGEFVIAAYRPNKGKERELLKELKQHMPILRGEGLITDRPSSVMRAKDGTILEVFEWKSTEAVEQAHHNKAVKEMWGRFNAVCDYVTLADLEESKKLFPPFVPVELS